MEMTKANKRLYEAMFLVDPVQASDWDKMVATVQGVLEKADGEVISIRKWDERRLAYQIDGKTRGTYILCYFRTEGRRIPEIERAVQLSEQIMRVLILNAEVMTREDMEKETPAEKADKEIQKAAPETQQGPTAPQESAGEGVQEITGQAAESVSS